MRTGLWINMHQKQSSFRDTWTWQKCQYLKGKPIYFLENYVFCIVAEQRKIILTDLPKTNTSSKPTLRKIKAKFENI